MAFRHFLFKKYIGGGSLFKGHIIDALFKKMRTGKPFRECLRESFRETFNRN